MSNFYHITANDFVCQIFIMLFNHCSYFPIFVKHFEHHPAIAIIPSYPVNLLLWEISHLSTNFALTKCLPFVYPYYCRSFFQKLSELYLKTYI